MKILCIHNFYQSFGGEDAVFLAEKELLQQEEAFDVVSYERHNDEIKQFNVSEKIRFVIDTVFSRRTLRDLSALVKQHAPEVAYVHNIFPLISPSVYSVLEAQGIPIVQVVHDLRLLCANGWMYRDGRICEKCKFNNMFHAVAHRCYRGNYTLSALYALSIGMARRRIRRGQIDAFLCMTDILAGQLRDIGISDDRIVIKPHFLRPSTSPSEADDDGYALYLGRLSSEKGILTLLSAFERLPRIPLRIMGSGPLAERAQKWISEKKMTNVSLLGFLEGEEKQRQIAGARLVVVPSEWYETFGMVVLDAYAAGKPVVAARIGSLAEIVQDGKTGTLFTPGDPGSLAKAIEHLHPDRERCAAMGKRGNALLSTEFSPAHTVSRLTEIFSRVTANRTAGRKRDI